MIVKESINFERGIDPKRSMGIGTYVPGRLFKYKDNFGSRPEFPNVYMYVEPFEKNYTSYFYIGRFINPQHSLFGAEFSFSEKMDSDHSWNLQPKKYDKFEPLSDKEEEKMKRVFSDPESEVYLHRIEKAAKIKPILRESVNFQRGLSDREIKDVLVGWREGQLLMNPHTNIVYVFLKEWNGQPFAENDTEIFSIGHLRNIGGASKTYFQKYKKITDADWVRTTFKPKKNLRSLTSEELHLVKYSLTSEYINKLEAKLESNFGIKVFIP